MSAPNTDPEKQVRQHRGPLIGMALVVVIGVGAIAVWVLDEASSADNPQGNDTGNPEVTSPSAEPSTQTAPTSTVPAPNTSSKDNNAKPTGDAATLPATNP